MTRTWRHVGGMRTSRTTYRLKSTQKYDLKTNIDSCNYVCMYGNVVILDRRIDSAALID
jgi:hypothetical protein